jgi:hypothetical protein
MFVVDQFSDPVMAHLVRRVADRPKLAAAIGDVDVDAAEREGLPDTAFAWPEKRAFPIHSREHTMLSRAYREGVENVPAYVDVALKEASEVYQINEELYTRPKVAAAPPPADEYLLPDIRRLRVKEAADVKEAEERLRTEGTKLSVPHRALASRRLVEKAAFFGVKLRPEIHKMAGMVVTERQPLVDWLEARREAAPIEHKDGYQKLANAAKRMPAELRDREQQVKLAEAISEMDELAGLNRFYDRKLPDPMMTVFNSQKIAGSGVTLAGRFVPMDRVAAYPSTFYSDILGPDIVREASDNAGGMDHHRLAAVLETLPVDMQRMLSSQMR